MLRTVSQNRQLHALISALSIDAEIKQDLVYQFTNSRETRSSLMTDHECQRLINHLNALKKQKEASSQARNEAFKNNTPENKMRRKIMSICHEMKWTKDGKLDWTRINEFLLNRSYLKKGLDKYTKAELPKLITQFENILRTYYHAQR